MTLELRRCGSKRRFNRSIDFSTANQIDILLNQLLARGGADLKQSKQRLKVFLINLTNKVVV